MKNYKQYIGKTFKGFRLQDEKYSDFSYADIMNDFIGKDLKIQHYHENCNCFLTDAGYLYPADLVISQLEKQTFKPERGDKVLVWDEDNEIAIESIFITQVEGAKYPYICVCVDDKTNFINGNLFDTSRWKNMKPLPEKEIAKDTLVWVRQYEQSEWYQRFYSHFSEGKHFCFNNQKKYNETENTTIWNIVTTKNPFEL